VVADRAADLPVGRWSTKTRRDREGPRRLSSLSLSLRSRCGHGREVAWGRTARLVSSSPFYRTFCCLRAFAPPPRSVVAMLRCGGCFVLTFFNRSRCPCDFGARLDWERGGCAKRKWLNNGGERGGGRSACRAGGDASRWAAAVCGARGRRRRARSREAAGL
jgi:hypothetical protein